MKFFSKLFPDEPGQEAVEDGDEVASQRPVNREAAATAKPPGPRAPASKPAEQAAQEGRGRRAGKPPGGRAAEEVRARHEPTTPGASPTEASSARRETPGGGTRLRPAIEVPMRAPDARDTQRERPTRAPAAGLTPRGVPAPQVPAARSRSELAAQQDDPHAARKPAAAATRAAEEELAAPAVASPAASGTKAGDDAPAAAPVKQSERSSSPRVPSIAEPSRNELQAAETLRKVAPLQARPLRELMFQLSLGRTACGWAVACRAALTPLLDAARRCELKELVAALDRLDAALKRAGAGTSTAIEPDAAAALQAGYRNLTSLLPDAFPAASHADARRKLLFEAVVLRAPGMQKRAIAKLLAAGMNSLEQLGRASVEELAGAAGVEPELARALIGCAQQFERERQCQGPAELQAQTERRLRALMQRLDVQRLEFERAEREEALERKRVARQVREAALLELDQVLAEAGEVELAQELQRCPLSGKIRGIERYLGRRQVGAQ